MSTTEWTPSLSMAALPVAPAATNLVAALAGNAAISTKMTVLEPCTAIRIPAVSRLTARGDDSADGELADVGERKL